MPLDKFQEIGVLASIIVDETQFAKIMSKGRTWEDSAFWRIVFNPASKVVDLFHCNSGTRSTITISQAGLLVPESFTFSPRQSGKQDDDRL